MATSPAPVGSGVNAVGCHSLSMQFGGFALMNSAVGCQDVTLFRLRRTMGTVRTARPGPVVARFLAFSASASERVRYRPHRPHADPTRVRRPSDCGRGARTTDGRQHRTLFDANANHRVWPHLDADANALGRGRNDDRVPVLLKGNEPFPLEARAIGARGDIFNTECASVIR
jgi:hypothetical protein